MRNFNPYIAGMLTAVAIFIIFLCAGNLIITIISSDLVPENQEANSSAATTLDPLSPADVVSFVTPTSPVEPASLSPTASLDTIDPWTPIPLLPTVTPAPPAAGATVVNTPASAVTPELLPTDTPIAPIIPTTRSLSAQVIDADDLQILSHQSYVDSLGWYHIVGEVQNNSDFPIEYVEVIAKLYDEAKEVIGTKLTFTAPDIIFPGGKAPFDIVTLRRAQWQEIKAYDLQVKGDAAEKLLKQNLELLDQNSRIQGEFLYVTGQVQNNGSTPALVKLIITLYDANLNVANTSWSYADSGVIPPADTSTFEVRINTPADLNNFHYRIQIEEEAVDTN